MSEQPLGMNGLNRKPGASRSKQKVGENQLDMPMNPYKERVEEFFTRFCTVASKIAGSYFAFGVALGTVVFWLISGPFFGFNDTWQLAINTGTTIITFLMVFLIQNTMNRDSEALHLKIDALLLTSPHTKNILVNLEELSQEDLDQLKERLMQLAGDKRKAKEQLQQGAIVADVKEETSELGEPPAMALRKLPIAVPDVIASLECG